MIQIFEFLKIKETEYQFLVKIVLLKINFLSLISANFEKFQHSFIYLRLFSFKIWPKICLETEIKDNFIDSLRIFKNVLLIESGLYNGECLEKKR